MTIGSAGTPVVVGIDGSRHALRALDWAAAEARQGGWRLRLVHAYQPHLRRLPARPAATRAIAFRDGQAILAAARGHLSSQGFGDLAVEMVLREGPPAHVLAQAADPARMLVVGRRDSKRFAEFLAGSTSLACARHGRLPVVVVPPEWQAADPNGGRVVVGVDGSPHCEAALEFAFETAARRGSRLVAVQAWELPNPYVVSPYVLDDETLRLGHDTARFLAETLDGWRKKYPDVPVVATTEHDHPVAALARHASAATLLVVGGRGRGTVTGTLLGSVTRGLLHHLSRPIAVVHLSRTSLR